MFIEYAVEHKRQRARKSFILVIFGKPVLERRNCEVNE
jgi:hypothetical protein